MPWKHTSKKNPLSTCLYSYLPLFEDLEFKNDSSFNFVLESWGKEQSFLF